MRDLDGFVETRRRLLELKSSNRMHWMAYALANHLAFNAEVAINVIDAYVKTEEPSER